MDRPIHEYKPLRVFKVCKGLQDFKSEMVFLAQLRRNYFGKIIFLGNFFKEQKPLWKYFFFLQDRHNSETYFFSMKRFRKAADEMRGFKKFLCGFLKLFYNSSRGFRKKIMPWKRIRCRGPRKVIKNF
jgi:hypothetical protein